MYRFIIRLFVFMYIFGYADPSRAMDDEDGLNQSDHSLQHLSVDSSLQELVELEDVEGDLVGDNASLVQLVYHYQKFCESINQNVSRREFNQAYQNFDESIFFPIAYNNEDDPSSFLQRARAIKTNIKAFIEEQEMPDFVTSLLEENIIPHLSNRIDLARLNASIFNDNGSQGVFNFTVNRNKTLAFLTGRIFQVTIDPDEPQFISSGSGVLIRWDNLQNEIIELIKGKRENLTHVLTCAHVINCNDGRSEFYFVQTKNLNIATGWPKNIDNEENLIGFLRDNSQSFQIGNFTIKNRQVNQFSTIELTMGQPQYFPNEDRVMGGIRLKEGQQTPSFSPFCKVIFQNNLPDGTEYYALGYPGCQHYETEEQDEPVNSMGFSPLFITHAIHDENNEDNDVTFVGGLISHKAPTAAGMSGGPLFYFPNTSAINIFGVITSGEDINEKGCY